MPDRANPLESHLFRHYWDDGLLDLFVGAGIVATGCLWLLDLVAVGPIIPVVLVPSWALARKRLIEPRAGLVEFSDSRSARNRNVLAGSVVLGLFTFALFIASFFWLMPVENDLLPVVIPGVPAFLIGLILALTGFWLGLPRFMIYAGLLMVGGIGVAIADARPEAAMISGGALVILGGVHLLIRFLQMDVENGDVV